MNRSDIGVVAFIYAVALFFGVSSAMLPEGSGVYPGCLTLALAALNTLYLILQLFKARKDGFINDLPDIFHTFQAKQFFVLFVFGCLYLFGIWCAGFYISTLLYLVGSLLFLKIPKLHILLTVIVLAALVYLAFTLFLKVPLPVGILFA